MATAETVDYRINVTGQQASSAKIGGVADSFRKLNASSADTAKTLGQTSERFSKLSAVSNAVNSSMGRLLGTFGQAAGAAQALSATIGGPIGLAAGGLIGAFALWSTYTDAQEKKLKSLKTATEEAGFAALRFDKQLEQITRDRGKTDRLDKLQTGMASSDEYEAELARLRNTNARLLAEQQAGNISSEYRVSQQYKNEALISEYEPRVQQARDREEIAKALASGGNRTGAIDDLETPRAAANDNDQSAARDQLDALRASGDERKALYNDQMRALSEVRKLYSVQTREVERLDHDARLAAIDAEYEASKDAAARRLEIRRQESEEYKQLEAQAEQEGKLRRQVAISGMQNVAGASVGALQKVAKGQKMTTAAFLEGIGDQAVADGTFRIMQGLAISVLNPAQGVPLMLAGGAEVAFGIGLGAAAARGGKGSAGGGGGLRANAAPVSAEPVGGAESEPRTVRSNIVVNVNANVVDDRAGVMIMQSLEEAHRKQGSRLPRGMVG
jgi:hypothetical protein